MWRFIKKHKHIYFRLMLAIYIAFIILALLGAIFNGTDSLIVTFVIGLLGVPVAIVSSVSIGVPMIVMINRCGQYRYFVLPLAACSVGGGSSYILSRTIFAGNHGMVTAFGAAFGFVVGLCYTYLAIKAESD